MEWAAKWCSISVQADKAFEQLATVAQPAEGVCFLRVDLDRAQVIGPQTLLPCAGREWLSCRDHNQMIFSCSACSWKLGSAAAACYYHLGPPPDSLLMRGSLTAAGSSHGVQGHNAAIILGLCAWPAVRGLRRPGELRHAGSHAGDAPEAPVIRLAIQQRRRKWVTSSSHHHREYHKLIFVHAWIQITVNRRCDVASQLLWLPYYPQKLDPAISSDFHHHWSFRY